MEWEEKALALSKDEKDRERGRCLELYRAKTPYREGPEVR